MFAISRFTGADDALLGELGKVAEYWRTCPGNVFVEVLRNVDDEGLAALVSHWDNIGSYRRAFSGYDAKMLLTPVMMKQIDEPGAYLRPDEI